jgi:hypothetical protein
MIGALVLRAASKEMAARFSSLDPERLVPNTLALLIDGLTPHGALS